MSLGIVELLTKIGDDRIKFQNLDQCMISANWSHKTGSKITFGTEASVAGQPGGEKEIGLVVWLPRDEVRKILDEARAGTQEGTDGR